MGRPALPVGTWGNIEVLPSPNGQFDARALFRDADGRSRYVQRRGASEGAAKNALRAALKGRAGAGVTGDEIRSDTKMSALIDLWWRNESSSWSHGTKKAYRSAVDNHVRPALANLTVAECTVGKIGAALTKIAETAPSAAKTTRACLSGMFTLAVRHGALPSNPARGAAKITIPRKRPKALTIDQADRLVDLLRSSKLAVDLDLPDLVEHMLGTGCRIGEALAFRVAVNADGQPLYDRHTWEINATIVRVPTRGLIVQERTKSEAGWRRIPLPEWVAQMHDRRATELRLRGSHGIAFGSPASRQLRDPNNTENALKAVLRGFDCDLCDNRGRTLGDDGKPLRKGNGQPVPCDEGPWAWITSHTFRKTVATRLKEAGMSAHQVADHLGHANPSMTQDVYFGRDVVSAIPAQVLTRPASR